MVTITLKNVPDKLHERLRARAARHRRSLNSEVIACLEALVMPQAVDADSFLARARALRREVAGRLSERKLSLLKNQGRP